ncbi:hypothetical protein [uncultured Fibrella sp.]|uniref:hypothetical protein n=1 Tax=uncultured Fibrella sp. TaxID=1284596 RepID=UPI0035C94A23
MANKKANTPHVPHYYVIYQINGAYRKHPARTYLEADEDLADVARQGAIPVAIYDVFDWRTDWKLPSPHKREEHEKEVLDITEEIRKRYE